MGIITNEPNEPNQQPPRHEVIYDREERRSGVERRQRARHEEKITAAALTGGSSLELVGGGAAAILAIVGLSGYLPLYMTAIATIAIGGALLVHGAAAAARWRDAMQQAASRRVDQTEIAGGVGSEMFGGACGIVLGILALADVVPLTLLSVAAIVLGGSILLGAPAQPDLARLAPDADRRIGRMTYEAVEGTSGAMVLVGVGAIVLGILALIEVGPPLSLVMVTMLAIGGALFLTGSALTARFARRLQQTT